MRRTLAVTLISLCLFVAEDVLGVSVTLTWPAPGGDGVKGTAFQYDLRYSTSPITDGNWSSAIRVEVLPKPSPAGTMQEYTLHDLEEGKQYYFALKASDEVPNWSPIYYFDSTDIEINVCIGIRGNVNGDDEERINVSDLTYLVQYLFGGFSGITVPCREEANVNGDGEERINISDINYLMDYLFGNPSGPLPPSCP